MNANPDVTPLRYTVPEAALLLRKSKAGLYIAVKEGRLKLSKDGRRSYVLPAELERYVAACDQREPEAA